MVKMGKSLTTTAMQESASAEKPDGESQFARGLAGVMTCLAIQGNQSRMRSSPYSYPTSSMEISTSYSAGSSLPYFPLDKASKSIDA